MGCERELRGLRPLAQGEQRVALDAVAQGVREVEPGVAVEVRERLLVGDLRDHRHRFADAIREGVDDVDHGQALVELVVRDRAAAVDLLELAVLEAEDDEAVHDVVAVRDARALDDGVAVLAGHDLVEARGDLDGGTVTLVIAGGDDHLPLPVGAVAELDGLPLPAEPLEETEQRIKCRHEQVLRLTHLSGYGGCRGH